MIKTTVHGSCAFAAFFLGRPPQDGHYNEKSEIAKQSSEVTFRKSIVRPIAQYSTFQSRQVVQAPRLVHNLRVCTPYLEIDARIMLCPRELKRERAQNREQAQRRYHPWRNLPRFMNAIGEAAAAILVLTRHRNDLPLVPALHGGGRQVPMMGVTIGAGQGSAMKRMAKTCSDRPGANLTCKSEVEEGGACADQVYQCCKRLATLVEEGSCGEEASLRARFFFILAGPR